MSYGSAYVATAFALRSFGPVPVAADRSVIGALAIAPLIAIRARASRAPPAEVRPRAGRRVWHLFVLGLLGGAIFLAGQSFAVAHVGATIAAFVAGLYAVLAAVLSPAILREPLRRQALVGFGLALIGTALLAKLDEGIPDVVGIAWGLGAALSFALFLVLTRKWAREDGLDGLIVAFATLLVTGVGLGSIALLSGDALIPASVAPEAWLAFAWLVVVAAGGQALAASSVRLIPASRSAAFLLLNPITATVLAFGLLGERPTPGQFAGGAFVLIGIAAATLRGSRLQRPNAAEH